MLPLSPRCADQRFFGPSRCTIEVKRIESRVTGHLVSIQVTYKVYEVYEVYEVYDVYDVYDVYEVYELYQQLLAFYIDSLSNYFSKTCAEVRTLPTVGFCYFIFSFPIMSTSNRVQQKILNIIMMKPNRSIAVLK